MQPTQWERNKNKGYRKSMWYIEPLMTDHSDDKLPLFSEHFFSETFLCIKFPHTEPSLNIYLYIHLKSFSMQKNPSPAATPLFWPLFGETFPLMCPHVLTPLNESFLFKHHFHLFSMRSSERDCTVLLLNWLPLTLVKISIFFFFLHSMYSPMGQYPLRNFVHSHKERPLQQSRYWTVIKP